LCDGYAGRQRKQKHPLSHGNTLFGVVSGAAGSSHTSGQIGGPEKSALRIRY
jgi:hypothetical protein